MALLKAEFTESHVVPAAVIDTQIEEAAVTCTRGLSGDGVGPILHQWLDVEEVGGRAYRSALPLVCVVQGLVRMGLMLTGI